MRYPVLLFALTLVLACSGAETGVVTPPPPPSSTPASVAVQAGDGQRSEPGDTLPIRAAVIVRNATGDPVSGVAVTFAIDSGGGSLSATAATTGANGVAESGRWTLGLAEGRNTLKVTAGALAPVKIAATAAVSVGSVPVTTLTSSGGSITVSQPGPLHGFSLNIPAGAYTTSTTWTMTYRSASTITKTAVMNPVSPIIHLTGTATSYSARLLTITIPATIPANTFPVIILRDPSTGLIEVLPTTDYDSVSVTAVTRHLNAAFFLKNNAARSAGLRGRSALRTGGYDVEVVVSTLTRAQLDADIDTGFRPGIDDWDFGNPGTFLQPDGICGGMTLTALWYFAIKKADGNLFHRLDRALDVPLSNRGGIRWASRVQAAQAEGVFDNAMQAATESAKRTPGVTAGQIRYDMIKAQLLVSQFPQLIIVANSDFQHAVMAYRTVGSNIYLADPNVPGGLDQKVRFGTIDFLPYYMQSTTGAGPISQMRYIAGIGASALYDWGNFPDQYDQAVDGSIDEAVFPVTEMRNRFGVLSDTIYVADTMATWVQCAACQSYPVPAELTGTSGPLAKLALFRDPGGNLPWTPRGGGFVNPLDPSRLSSPGDYPFGYAIFGKSGSDNAWIDWKTFIVRKLDASITPAAPTDIVGNPISFAMQVTPNKLPSDVIYRWDFNDGSATVSVNNNNTVQHAFPREGSFVIAAQILDAKTQQPVAKATATVTITPGIQAWKFISTSVAFSVSQPPVVEYGSYDGRWRVDSTILARIHNGDTQGGFRIVDQAFTAYGFPLRTAPVGLYLLEGTSLTLANLLGPATQNTFSVVRFWAAPLAFPAAPQVSGWNVVQQDAPENSLCNIYENSYVFTGSVTSGHLTGLRVPVCMQSDDFQIVNGQRLLSMDVDVTFGATTATGTISVIYYFYGSSNPLTWFQRIARLTFQATRLVN